MVQVTNEPKTFKDGEEYHWFENQGDGSGNWTNTSKFFAVIIGCDVIVSAANAIRILVVKDQKGNFIDSITVSAQSAAGYIIEYMPRRMIVPPGGIFNLGASTFFQAALCATFKAALLISR